MMEGLSRLKVVRQALNSLKSQRFTSLCSSFVLSSSSSSRTFRSYAFDFSRTTNFDSHPWNSFQGLASDTPSSKNDDNGSSTTTHSGGTRTTVAIICLSVAAVVLFCFFLFKLWQKKKREEQYARLLKLFEEDDELEVELGLRE